MLKKSIVLFTIFLHHSLFASCNQQALREKLERSIYVDDIKVLNMVTQETWPAITFVTLVYKEHAKKISIIWEDDVQRNLKLATAKEKFKQNYIELICSLMCDDETLKK